MSDEEIEISYDLIKEYDNLQEIKKSFNLSEKQQIFANSKCDESFYGGAKGGGKSYATIADAFCFALEYEGSRQLILRRTFPELNRTLIPLSRKIFPPGYAKFSDKFWKFNNGSLIEFGYMDGEADVHHYQGAEYDVIRFDELTNFTEYQYTTMISCIRGVNSFPKCIKTTGNPGGVGHNWVREKFIDDKEPNKIYYDEHDRTLQFIPAKVYDNKQLMDADPRYLLNLKQLPEMQRRALLDGDWYAFEGMYFPEFKHSIHTISPTPIPKEWTRFRSVDYGLDMCCCLWYAISPHGKCIVYRELHEPNLNLTSAAKKILDLTHSDERIKYTVASPDLWNRRQETGLSGQRIMERAGLRRMVKANNSRIQGWRMLREYLQPFQDEQNITTAKLVIFRTCTNICKYLPQLQHDKLNPEDVSGKPHAITHAPESLRYGIMSIESGNSNWSFA